LYKEKNKLFNASVHEQHFINAFLLGLDKGGDDHQARHHHNTSPVALGLSTAGNVLFRSLLTSTGVSTDETVSTSITFVCARALHAVGKRALMAHHEGVIRVCTIRTLILLTVLAVRVPLLGLCALWTRIDALIAIVSLGIEKRINNFTLDASQAFILVLCTRACSTGRIAWLTFTVLGVFALRACLNTTLSILEVLRWARTDALFAIGIGGIEKRIDHFILEASNAFITIACTGACGTSIIALLAAATLKIVFVIT